jgi:ATP-binding cassette subfamily B protein
MITEHGSNLSGGQRQRISIARALIRNPKIIILDEATSALDSISEQKIQIAVSNLVKNRTTFIVTHRLSTIKNADRIAFIKDGKCTEIGSYEELIEQKGDFYELKNLQEL